MSTLRLAAVKDASTTHQKDIFELPLTGLEPFDDENWQAGGRSIRQSSHQLDGDLSSEETRHLGTIGTAAQIQSRVSQIAPLRVRFTTGIPLGARWKG